jgi:ABC-type lipoprotein export system ATPase subunit
MFQQLNEEEGITIILVTHDANVARHARRTIRIKDGIIESDASAPGEAESDSGATATLKESRLILEPIQAGNGPASRES